MRARKDEAKRARRVELRREDSGAAQLSGRELDPADAVTGKASIDAEAARLRKAGLPGSLGQIRAMVLMDRIHQRSPWDRLAPIPEPGPEQEPEPEPGDEPGLAAGPAAGPETDAGRPGPDSGLHGDGQFPDPGDDDDDDDDDDGQDHGESDGDGGDDGGDGDGGDGDGGDDGGGEDDDADADEGHPGGRTPAPALINITVPVDTLLGWLSTPAQVGAGAGAGVLSPRRPRRRCRP